MVFALDFDKTFNAAPELWLTFIESAKAQGHRVIGCTMRYPHETFSTLGEDKDSSVWDAYVDAVDRVYFTSREAKLPALEREGVSPDVWIDDNPLWLYTDG